MAVMAPSSMLKLSLGTISSGSNFISVPNPEHSGQAPLGLLNEKFLGSISLMLIPQLTQAKFWLKIISSSLSGIFTLSIPPDSAITVSMDSVSLF